jgi:type II secretory pathway component PulF
MFGAAANAGKFVKTDDGEQTTFEKIMSFSVEFGPSNKEILNFTNQLAVMIRAGISLQESLESIASQVEKKKFKAILMDLKKRIEEGASFSQALSEHPTIFSNLYINMVGAAEVSGSLSQMLQQLAEYLDQEADTRSQVVSAMVYPIIIAVMAVVCVGFLLMFVLPRFLVVFAGKEHMLPASTKIIMAASKFTQSYWYLILTGVAVVIAGFLMLIKTDAGRYWWDGLKLKIPVFKKLCSCLYITRGLHTMGVMINAGVPVLDTIVITANVSGNMRFEKMWKAVCESVRQGKKISYSLEDSGLMPGNVVQMIRSGEESGTLSEVLSDVAEFYGRELKTVIKITTSMIEPIMIVVMGILVGFIASSIILPIFKMSSSAMAKH